MSKVIYLDPGLLYFDNSTQSPEATKPVVTKIRTEPSGIERIKTCSNCPGHMSNMAHILFTESVD